MSEDGDSGGIIGTIISIFILIAIWPYLLALLGIYIAYLMAIAILEWIAANAMLVIACAIGFLAMYLTYRLRLIPKGIDKLKKLWNPRPLEGFIEESKLMDCAKVRQSPRAFIPSTNLYCYWCTKKLGMKAWEKEGKYYCDECKKADATNRV